MPSDPLVVPPLLLAVVLVVSGVAKVRDARNTEAVMRQLELPAFVFTIRAQHLLPWGELVVAAALLLLPGGWYVVAASLALLLFAAYVVVVARALTFGHPLMCGCFGRLGLGWITRRTLVRNLVLLALAALTWVDSLRDHGVLQRLDGLGRDGWWWLAGVVLALVTTFLVAREGPPPTPVIAVPGDDDYTPLPIPYGVLDGPEGPGTTWRLADTAARMLVFWDPRKEHADAIAARLADWQRDLAPVVVHLVSGSEWATVRDMRPELADHLLGDPDAQTRLRLGVYDEPGAVLLGTDRLLAGGPVEGLAEIEELVVAAAAEISAASQA